MRQLRSRVHICISTGLLKFFLAGLVHRSDDEILELAEKYENEIKQIKHQAYKFSWYLRGGATAEALLNDTDYEDFEIISKIIKENVEATKTTKMPLV